MSIEHLLIIMVFVAITGAGMYLGSIFREEMDKTWKSAADALGLGYRSRPKRIIVGNYEGVAVRVEALSNRHSDGTTTDETRYQIVYPALGLGLKLTRESLLDVVGKTLGAQDIEVGENGFDEKFFIKGSSDEAVKSFLTPGRRRRIERLVSFRRSDVSIEDSSITMLVDQLDTEARIIVSTIHMLARTARHLHQVEEDDPGLDEANAPENDRDLEAVLKRLRQITGKSKQVELDVLPDSEVMED